MQKLMTILSGSLIWAATVNGLNGQSIEFSEEAVRTSFEDPSGIQWAKQYTGSMDHFHQMEMWMAYNGSEYRGTYRYVSSQDIFQLEGYEENGKAVIQEIDLKGNTSAYIMGALSEDGMDGYWWNADFTKRRLMHFIPAEIVEINPFRAEFIHFKGSLAGQVFQILLTKESGDLASGMIYTGQEARTSRMQGGCATPDCGRLVFHFEENNMPGTITLSKRKRSSFDVEFRSGATVLNGQCEAIETVPLGQETFASYQGSFDVIYPEFDDEAYQMWISGRIAEIREEHLNVFEAGVSSLERMIPRQRDAVSSTGWVDISFYNDELISGILTLYDGIREDYLRYPFNFDRKAGEAIDFSSLCKRDVNFSEVCRQFVTEHKTGLLDELEGDEADWIKQARFHHIVLLREGLAMFTDFHPVFGDRFLVMPHDTLSSFLKRRSAFIQRMQ